MTNAEEEHKLQMKCIQEEHEVRLKILRMEQKTQELKFRIAMAEAKQKGLNITE